MILVHCKLTVIDGALTVEAGDLYLAYDGENIQHQPDMTPEQVTSLLKLAKEFLHGPK